LGLQYTLEKRFDVTRCLETLFSVSPGGPATFAMVARVLGLVTLLACYTPLAARYYLKIRKFQTVTLLRSPKRATLSIGWRFGSPSWTVIEPF
jgi:hypothetical protein